MPGKEETKHIASLARLGLSEEETAKIQKELSKILDYFKLIQEVDVSGIKPTYYPLAVKNVLREDRDKVFSSDPELNKKLIEAFPEKEERRLKVKAIL
ncbi:Asp-tRNA(Asn)/Glu-tRNA(Gln) amidotransferase subunit GatC [bacterium]|nr:Asp-tRNA(Asn)/Glu-tRNA(Gln) amidotransferase subunit GatC [bacterium]